MKEKYNFNLWQRNIEKKIVWDIKTYDFCLFSILNQLRFCGTLSAPFRLIMNFVLKPSLEHMALVKIVISLWSQNDIKVLISEFSSDGLRTDEKWKTIEERVIQKVTQISLPHLLKGKMLGFIKPIGLQISEWIGLHEIRLDFPAHLPAEFCWTPQGTVDRKRTAEVLVKNENLDMSRRYQLACIYCLEDDIIQFWNNLTDNLKESVSYRPEIIFWSRIMRRGGSHIDYKDEFNQCADWGNKVAAEYFLQKLTPTERKESLVETAKYIAHADTLRFLISEMNEEQQMEVFKKNPYRVLRSFLYWPWQSFFIEIASSIWDFLSKNNYDNILGAIINKIRDGYKDCNYQMLFREFWQKSPSVLKDSVIDEIEDSWFLECLFRVKDKEIIRLILKDATFTAKEKLIYSDYMNSFFQCCIRENEWDFLEFCIRECFPSKNEMLKFKEEFEKHMCPYFKEHFATKKPRWHLLFCFSDDSICKCDKRSLEEDESSSSKQFRGLS